MDASGPLARGRHRSLRHRSLALGNGSCLLPLQVTFCSHAADSLFGAFRGSNVIAGSVVIAVFFRRLPADRSIRGDLTPFHLPVATPERFGGIVCSSKTAGSSTSTLAHSSNSSVLYRLCSPRVPKPRNRGRDSVSRSVCAICATFHFASQVATAHRLAS
jgi:hypothetical protein